MRVAALMVGALLGLSVQASPALTIRGDELWRSNRGCPQGWSAPDADDSAWAGVDYPWYHHWPPQWEADPAAIFFWGHEPSSQTCVRRHFHLDAVPPAGAIAHAWVDDDYDLYINGTLIRASGGPAADPNAAYDLSRWLRAGDNVIAMKLIDHGGSMGALFSLTVAALPDAPPTWFELKRRVMPWVQFAAILCLVTITGAMVARLRSVLARPLSRLSPAALALLIALLAAVCQAVLATHVFYRGMTEFFSFAAGARDYPLAHWNWPAVGEAAALFLLLVAVCGATSPADEAAPARRSEIVVLAAIVIVAVILRTYRIDSIPVGFFQDEAINGNDGTDLIQSYPEAGIRVWSDSIGGRPTLFLYLVGVSLRLLGSSYLTLKIVPMLFGVGAVAAIYALGRVALGPRVALWAAFFLAVSRWHIHYSRMAWEAICVPLFSTTGFALLLYGLRRERRSVLSLVTAALVLSAGLYTYASYRAVPVVVIVFLIVTLLSSDRHLIVRRDTAVGLIVGAVLAAAVALPLALFAWHEPNRYWERFNDVSLANYMAYFGTPLPWVHMLGKGLLSFNAEGDTLIRHNLPLAPHLDVITGALFLVGLAAAVWPRRPLGVRLLWIWLLIFLGLATMTSEVPHATRLLGLAPAAALFAAFGTAKLLGLLRAARQRPAFRIALASLVLGLIGLNSYQYFIVEANDRTADAMLDLTGRTLCEYVRQLDGVDVYWTPDIAFFAGDQCHFLARGRFTDYELTLERAQNPAAMHKERPVVAVIGPEFLADHRREIPRAADGRPLLDFPVEPIVKHDRQGNLLYYLYRF